ncbi:hypothetical protein CTRI78_v006296 [Colletotrichum trifolii]|uniref:Uncharacterized protein n=1 Tax=Colletotrichum trifolii TaxID=5466 RepID=A0A4R8RJC1_COLTR|nr:hypothetical protein CTRI78_v006296 [Colletotrichum trifolii]
MFSSKDKAFDAHNGNPPPYPDNIGEAPPYEAPTFNDTAMDSTRLTAATAKFPPTFNCYYVWKFKQVYYLGPTSDEKLYTISYDQKIFSRKQSLFLHDGPSDKDRMLATVSRQGKGWHDHASITVHRQHGGDVEVAFEPLEHPSWKQAQVRAFHFRTAKGVVEEFQWRTSHGSEIKELAGHSTGWKLVRMSQAQAQAGTAGPSREPKPGFASDGQEVVAVLAHNMSWSMTKGSKFAFMGSGLTGTLGEEWETAAVASGFWLWWLYVTASAGTAGAAAGAGAAVAAGGS